MAKPADAVTMLDSVMDSDVVQPLPEEAKKFESQEKQKASILSNVVRRRNSLTLPSKKSSKPKSKSVTMRKRISMPFFPKNSLDTLENSEQVNSSRPLPPSPPSSPNGHLKSITEQEAEFDGSLGSLVTDVSLDTTGRVADDKLSNHASECSSTQSVDENFEMQLKDALKRFSKRFPLRIRFIEGYCSENSEHNLSANEMYDIHNVQNTRVVSLRDKDGFMHQIPLESATMFGLVYNPFGNFNEALNGYKFETCKEVMAANPMPTIVCLTNPAHGPDDYDNNEIYVIKGIQKNKLRGKRFLKVFSILNHAEKLLSEDYHGNFTTKPSLIRLHLPQIVESIAKPFPVQAVIYIDNQSPSFEFPISGVITLCDFREETSLLASPIIDVDSDRDDEETPLTIHLNDDMMELDVEVIKWQDGVQTSATNGSNDYDDVVVVPKSKPLENGVYDDVINSPRKPTSDEETYATVGREVLPHKPTDDTPGYDNLPKELVQNPNETTEAAL